MSRRYSNPPIVEAVCEFRFIRNHTDWKWAIVERLVSQIRGDFNDVVLNALSMRSTPKPNAFEVTPAANLQFTRKDKTALANLKVDSFSVSLLKPYSSWREFLPLISRILSAYRDNMNPKGVGRAGLRYINHIKLPSEATKLTDYFDLYLFAGSGLPQNQADFYLTTLYRYEEGRDALRLQMSPVPDGLLSLDLDYYLNKSEAVALEGAVDWLETAHSRIEEAFEASIKDPLRTTLKPLETE